jgi:hypothetical protein
MMAGFLPQLPPSQGRAADRAATRYFSRLLGGIQLRLAREAADHGGHYRRRCAKARRIANRNEAIKTAVDIYLTPLIAAASSTESPPTFWFVVIPEEVYELGRPLSKVPVPERIQGSVRMTRSGALKLEEQHALFGIEEAETEVYKYATHFRRQLKARLLNDKIVMQIVRETTPSTK